MTNISLYDVADVLRVNMPNKKFCVALDVIECRDEDSNIHFISRNEIENDGNDWLWKIEHRLMR